MITAERLRQRIAQYREAAAKHRRRALVHEGAAIALEQILGEVPTDSELKAAENDPQ